MRYRRGFLRFSVLAALVLAAGPAVAQINEADRLERCVNNRNAIAMLTIVQKTPESWSDETLARARTAARSLAGLAGGFEVMLEEVEFAEDEVDVEAMRRAQSRAYTRSSEIQELVGPFEVRCDYGPQDFECSRRIYDAFNQMVERAEADRSNGRDIERRLADHRTNLIALDCDRLASGANAGVAAPSQWMSGTFDSSFGLMTFGPGGGTYDYQGGRVGVGSINGTVVEGIWEQTRSAKQCPDGRYWGKYRFDFNAGGFSGSYDYCGDTAGGGWSGTRRGG